MGHGAKVAGITGLVFAGVLGLAGGCGAILNNWELSQGERVGMINKLSKKGIVFKTLEAQMALEGISSTGNSIGANVWEFSVEDSKLADELRSYMDSGAKVKVTYTQNVLSWPWRGDTTYFVKKIDPVRIQSNTGTSNSGNESSNNSRPASGGLEIYLDGRNYFLRHDREGKLKITELKEVQ